MLAQVNTKLPENVQLAITRKMFAVISGDLKNFITLKKDLIGKINALSEKHKEMDASKERSSIGMEIAVLREQVALQEKVIDLYKNQLSTARTTAAT